MYRATSSGTKRLSCFADLRAAARICVDETRSLTSPSRWIVVEGKAMVPLACTGVEQGGHKAFIAGGGQGQHGKAMMKFRELAIELMGRQVGRNKVDAAQLKFICSSPGNGQMAPVYRIERAAKQGQLHLLFL